MNVLASLMLVQQGRILSLARPRFRGMPNLAAHPTFDIVSYRTPRGLRAEGDETWTTANEASTGYISELILGSAHTGAHIDALSHVTGGQDDEWHGGGQADRDLGDFGPAHGDAAALEPIWARGVLLDVAGHRGVDALPRSEPISAAELRAVADERDITIGPGNVVLIRTGYMSRWPHADKLAQVRDAGPDISAARWLSSLAIRATGTDTEAYEALPPPPPPPGEPTDAMPVHTHLLRDQGILIMEGLDLEPLATAGIHEFLFVALPIKIRGATGAMIDPIAVV